MKVNYILAGLILATSQIQAEEVESNYAESSGFYGSIGTVSIDEKVAYMEGIGDSATYWKFGWEQRNIDWIWGVGISGYLYDDKYEFSQQTQDNFGNKKDSESSATAFNAYLEGGYRYIVNQNFDVALLAGYEAVLSSDRGIGLCTNCYSEDIDVSAGLYAQPRMTYTWDNGWYGALGYNAYFGGDVSNALMITLGATW